MNKIDNGNSFTTIIDGYPYTVDADHPEYEALEEAVDEDDPDTFLELYDDSEKVNTYFEGTDLSVDNGTLFYGDEPLHGQAATTILKHIEDGRDPQNLINFLDRLMDNPDDQPKSELFRFLQDRQMPIQEDGTFLAYKAIRDDYLDKHSGSIDNSPGESPSMARGNVVQDPNRACAAGLHVGDWSYAGPGGSFHGSSNRVVLVEVDPKDAVSVPYDHGDSKLRTTGYTVVKEVELPPKIGIWVTCPSGTGTISEYVSPVFCLVDIGDDEVRVHKDDLEPLPDLEEGDRLRKRDDGTPLIFEQYEGYRSQNIRVTSPQDELVVSRGDVRKAPEALMPGEEVILTEGVTLMRRGQPCSIAQGDVVTVVSEQEGGICVACRSALGTVDRDILSAG